MGIFLTSPCSEDWNTMSATEKGAFCKKCALEVIDFSGKSSAEIRNVLSEYQGKRVCGKIEPSKMAAINRSDYFPVNAKEFQRRFVWSLLLVFGLTLFSCSTVHKDSQPEEIALSETLLQDNQSFEHQQETLETEPIVLSHEVFEKSFVGLEDTIVSAPEIDFEPFLLGGLIYEEFEILPEEIHVDSTVIELDSTRGIELMDVLPSLEKTISVYPNPSNGEVRIEWSQVQGGATVEIYTISGQQIAALTEGREFPSGVQRLDVDLSNQPSGAYIVRVSNAEGTASTRLIKE